MFEQVWKRLSEREMIGQRFNHKEWEVKEPKEDKVIKRKLGEEKKQQQFQFLRITQDREKKQ